MKITSIEPQAKNKDRLNLYIDSAFRCGVTVGTAARLALYEGKEVSEFDIARIDNEEDYQKCMNNALDLVTRRLQSERELWQKLSRRHENPVIGRCLDRLRTLGYANDTIFAEMWVNERSTTRGRKLLEAELGAKGIDKTIISNTLDSVNIETEIDSATSLAKKKYKSHATKEENYTRIMGLLTRKGYSYALSKQVINNLLNPECIY